MESLAQQAAELGISRDHLFTHGAGWKDGELNYFAALNSYSCPGWSFYKHAADPGRDAGVQQALKKTDAPYWAATEWLLQGASTAEAWTDALAKTLSDPKCRYLCIFNWEGIQGDKAALAGISSFLRSDR
jgi:hypothetical protein